MNGASAKCSGPGPEYVGGRRAQSTMALSIRIFPGRSSWPVMVLRAVPAVVLVGFLVFRYGNPQWHRYIYILRVHILPPKYKGNPARLGLIPSDFTGVWVNWDRQGNKRAETEYRGGAKHGKAIRYRVDGSVSWKGNYELDRLHGKVTKWWWWSPGMKSTERLYSHGRIQESTWWDEEDGNVIAEGVFRNHHRWEGTFVEQFYGVLDVVSTYKDGKVWEGKKHGGGDGMVQTFRNGVVVATEPGTPGYSYGGTLKDGKPWRGRFQRWDNDKKRFVLKTYWDGVVVDVATEADIAAQEDAVQQYDRGSSKVIVVPLP